MTRPAEEQSYTTVDASDDASDLPAPDLCSSSEVFFTKGQALEGVAGFHHEECDRGAAQDEDENVLEEGDGEDDDDTACGWCVHGHNGLASVVVDWIVCDCGRKRSTTLLVICDDRVVSASVVDRERRSRKSKVIVMLFLAETDLRWRDTVSSIVG